MKGISVSEAARTLLLEAYEAGREEGGNFWEYALSIPELVAAGLTPTQLRCLIRRGYAEQAIETTRPQAPHRTFRRVRNGALEDRACLVLTTRGASWAQSAHPGATGTSEATRPHWDEARRRLSRGDVVLKEFRRSAPNQEDVLNALQEQGWPPISDDPLPPRPGEDPAARLRDTIKGLNRCHRVRMLRFRTARGGKAICWEWLSEGDSPTSSAAHY